MFVSKNQLYSLSKDKKIIQFGAGEIARKTRKNFNNLNYDCILDNSGNLWDEKEDNLIIHNPNFLENFANLDGYLIIICTTSFQDVSNQLQKLGYKPNDDYVVSPLLNDLKIIKNLEELKTNIYFTSGSPPVENENNFGGGIYKLSIDKHNWSIEKKFSGNVYGLIKVNNNYFATDNSLGVCEFDKDLIFKKSYPLLKNSRPHGISYSSEYNKFFVVCSYRDSVIILSENFKIEDEIKFSFKYDKFQKAFHHANDCEINGESLYVSMFSETGNWTNDIFDGAIVEYNFINKSKVGAPVRNLWMPHNIKLFNNDFYVLNSLKGELLGNNMGILGKFSAFTRGLDFNNEVFAIGQSRNRNFSKNLGVSQNNSIDTGIVIFEGQTKTSRFIQLDPRLSEIHSIKFEN